MCWKSSIKSHLCDMNQICFKRSYLFTWKKYRINVTVVVSGWKDLDYYNCVSGCLSVMYYLIFPTMIMYY